MSLLIPNAAEPLWLGRFLYGRGGAITGATNASPAVITSTAHGLSNGNSVNITDVGGNTACNGGPFVVNNVATNTFQIATISGTTLTLVNGNGAYTSGGSWSLAGMEDLQLKLFSSSTTPAETDTAGTYTVLTPGSGYSVQTLTSKLSSSAGWTTPASGSPTGSWSSEASVAESTSPQIVFSFSGSFTVNGYILVFKDSTTIAGAENFGSTKNISSGDTLTMTPRTGAS